MSDVVTKQLVLGGPESLMKAKLFSSVEGPDAFLLAGVELAFDHMRITDYRLTPMHAVADGSHHHSDIVTLFFVLEGTFTIEYGNQRLRFTPGSAAYLTSRTSISADSLTPTRLASITMQRSVLEEHDVHLAAEFGSFAYSATQVSPALTYLRDLIDVAGHTTLEAGPVHANIVQLVIGLFVEDRAYDVAS